MKNLKNDVKAWLLLGSGLGTILLLMGSTFYIVVAQSFGLHNINNAEPHFTLEFWQTVLADTTFQNPCFTRLKSRYSVRCYQLLFPIRLPCG